MPNRILFVDDDAELLRAICRSLEATYDIETATSGFDALKILNDEGPFDCVVSDMQMPQMDGVDLVLKIRESWAHLPCIILTGNQDEATAIRANEVARVDRFLNKPCPRSDLVDAINKAIASKRVSATSTQMLAECVGSSACP